MSDQNLSDFLSWAKNKGAFIDPKLEFQYSQSNGYSVILKDFSRDEELIRIPKNVVVGPHLNNQFLPGIKYTSLDSSFSNNEMTILLISKLAFDTSLEDEYFKPYFKILPKNLNTPYFWNSNEIDLIDGTDAEIILKRNFSKLVVEWHDFMNQIIQNSVKEEIRSQIIKDLQFYDEVISNIPENSYHGELFAYLNHESKSWTSFRNYLWSFSILTSRGFPYMLLNHGLMKDDLQKAVLLPIIDLLNHKNDCKVKWKGLQESNGSYISFQCLEKVNKQGELYNNYGDKSNQDLLLGYGFVIENNKYDNTTISLKIDSNEPIKEALKHGIPLSQNSDEIYNIDDLAEGINFKIGTTENLPNSLVNFFAILNQMEFEKDVGITLRMQLNGISQLMQVLEGKILRLKAKIISKNQVNDDVKKIVKIYRNEQKKIFQNTLDLLLKYEKELLKNNTTRLLSLKTILKSDPFFKCSLLKVFKVNSYEEIIKNQIVTDVIILWITTLSRSNISSNKPLLSYQIENQLKYIYFQIEDVSKSIHITVEDLNEYRPRVSSYFSEVLKIWPGTFKNKKHFLEKYVIADTVLDRLGYLRPSNSEFFLVQKHKHFA